MSRAKDPSKQPAPPAMPAPYHLLLFIAGHGSPSKTAVAFAKTMARDLSGRCRLEIVDVTQQPALALEHMVLVTPTLVVLQPPPSIKLVGDLSGPRASAILQATLPLVVTKTGTPSGTDREQGA